MIQEPFLFLSDLVKGQTCMRSSITFLANASPPKLLDVATVQVHISHKVEGSVRNFVYV